MKEVLITGAGGFLGRNLAEQLNYNLLTPTHAELELENKEAVDRFFEKNHVDVVIHCASYGDRSNLAKHDMTIWMNLVNHTNEVERIIHIGSGAEYDKRFPLVRVKEEDFGRHVPDDDYGQTKFLISRFIEEAATDKVVCLRAFGLFGKYEDPERRFISRSIRRVLEYDPILIYKNVRFDYLWVDDFVRVVDHFVTHQPAHRFYNVGTGKPVTLLEVAQRIKHVADRPVNIKVLQDGMENEYTCNVDRLMAELGDFKLTPFDRALKDLYDWYKV